MERSTTELTIEYINEHPYIKRCLQKGIINYSSLARMIAKDLGIEKKTSNEAILIAARRFQEKLKKELNNEQKIRELLTHSEISIQNKMHVFILEKNSNLDVLEGLQKKIGQEGGISFVLEGSDNYTIIIQEKYASFVKSELDHKLIRSHQHCALINFKSPKEIEELTGVLAYLTSLFAENGVNIIEFLSCWRDTLFIVDAKDVQKALTFLNF
ncbi:TPA: ACT domain-containing protein [Candidatus Woesearchaeota archaeon]|nr:MAG: hypothetical protein QT07_C0003G0014 [archaeon GW2011_AR16]HIG95806.1 ACT domain-containing protein [Candidatus Woesearchaeota archaeon]HIH47566.1 ACT domain-containing protein [Candidatus Woesearchaeota archaeon]HII88592.1 ACT domain-containing protein [Candidatus Woesearchaeota archaeon]